MSVGKSSISGYSDGSSNAGDTMAIRILFIATRTPPLSFSAGSSILSVSLATIIF